MLTFNDLQDRVLRWIDEPTDVDTTLQIVKDAINASHRRLLGTKQWAFMAWPEAQSFTTVSGIGTYALNPNVDRAFHLWDTVLKQYTPVVPRREWPAVGANRSNTDTPPYGVTFGPNWPVETQPETPGVVSIVSSSSSDTTGSVVVRGVTSTGYIASETITVTGTTIANGAISFTSIVNLTKKGTWVGTLTVTSGSTTLLTLGTSQTGLWFRTVEFLELPQSGRTFSYNFQRQPMLLENDEDLPETPYPYSEFHVYDTLLDLTTYNTELGGKEQAMWTKRSTELLDGLIQAYDEEIVGAYPKFVRDLSECGLGSRVGVYNP